MVDLCCCSSDWGYCWGDRGRQSPVRGRALGTVLSSVTFTMAVSALTLLRSRTKDLLSGAWCSSAIRDHAKLVSPKQLTRAIIYPGLELLYVSQSVEPIFDSLIDEFLRRLDRRHMPLLA